MVAHGNHTTSDVIKLEDKSPELIGAYMKGFKAFVIETDNKSEGDDKFSELSVI